MKIFKTISVRCDFLDMLCNQTAADIKMSVMFLLLEQNLYILSHCPFGFNKISKCNHAWLGYLKKKSYQFKEALYFSKLYI